MSIKDTTNETPREGIPDSFYEILSPLHQCISFIMHTHELLKTQRFILEFFHVTAKGPPGMEFYKNCLGERFDSCSRAAKNEMQNGYMTLMSNQLISTYSRFESAIYDVVLSYFKNIEPGKLPEIYDKATDLADFLRQSEEDQIAHLSSTYIKQKKQNNEYGFHQFEAILEPLLGKSTLHKEHKENFHAFAQTRNLLLHKNGIVDLQFKQKIPYPHIKAELGKKIKIDYTLLELYIKAMVEYSVDITVRVAKICGLSKVKISEIKKISFRKSIHNLTHNPSTGGTGDNTPPVRR